MKYILLFLCLVFFSVNVNAQPSGCGKFRDGTFRLVDPVSGTSIIKRKGSRQTETISSKKGRSTFIVKWIDDCTYTLTPTRRTRRKFGDLPEDSYLVVKIIEVNESSYVQTCKFNFLDMELTNEMVLIK